MADPIYPGSEVVGTVTLRVGGALTNATTATWTLIDPRGVSTSYAYPAAPETAKPSTGTYTLTVTIPSNGAGTWKWEFLSTGIAAGAAKGTFGVSA